MLLSGEDLPVSPKLLVEIERASWSQGNKITKPADLPFEKTREKAEGGSLTS